MKKQPARERTTPLPPAPSVQTTGGPKVRHWVMKNSSGMHRVAESLAVAETALGMESACVDVNVEVEWMPAMDADIHVIHTHFPSKMQKQRKKGSRLVWVGHGTPDHVFQSTVEMTEQGNYGHGDGVMLMQHWLKTADAKVTFWARHKWIYDRMLTTGARPTDLVPMGADTAFWAEGATLGKFAGEPSFFTAENPHYFKWPYDLITAWPDVLDVHCDAKLHMVYLPRDMHRAFFPWMNANGSAFGAYVSPGVFDHAWLRNAFKSTDYTIGLVRYGDMNHLSLQANAAGATTISYAGNPHSDYWVTEGDQRALATQLLAIMAGQVEKRDKTPVPDLSTMAAAMRAVYEGIL